MSDVWQLAEAVTLRPEAFGGMVFHRERGVTLEVDAEAYRFLCTCLAPRPLPPPGHPAARLVPQLVRLGFLCPAEVGPEQAQPAPVEPGPALPLPSGDGFTLSAPEAVHLAITTRCNLACPGCYVPRPSAGPEWTVAELCGLIEQWARMRVFQLAVGGGEPLLYEGLFDVLAHARQQGIVPNLTTNGTLLNADVVRRLEQAGVARVNVSWSDILDPAFLRWRGIYGCAAGRRICTVWPDGRVTPCSFLADLSAGNARQTPFAELWERGENWSPLRDPIARPQNGCTGCAIALQCGGARCVARHERSDLLAGDAECPYYRYEESY